MSKNVLLFFFEKEFLYEQIYVLNVRRDLGINEAEILNQVLQCIVVYKWKNSVTTSVFKSRFLNFFSLFEIFSKNVGFSLMRCL